MSSSFFLKKELKTKKRKFGQSTTGDAGAKGKKYGKTKDTPATNKKPQKDDEEIASESEDESVAADGHLQFSSDEEERETPQDKRLRLAKQYLQQIEQEEAERAEDKEFHNQVSHRLQTEYLDSVGKLRRNIAASIEGYNPHNIVKLKHWKHNLSICALALSPDGYYLFAGAKTQFVLKWNLKTCRVEGSIDVKTYNEDSNSDIKRRPHVTALCVSSDFRFLALSEGGKNIQVWCPKQLTHFKTFQGHRDVVTALVFRKGSHELYSASRDRSVKIWSLDEMAYVESLFGHQAAITDIDALTRERPITAGGPDCTLRIWKITEESQLIYNGHMDSIERVKFLNEENFISAGTDGSLGLWTSLKKKPLCTENLAHGLQTNGAPNWITAIACVVNSDLIASGSCDGFIRLWQCSDNHRKLKRLLQIPLEGFINCLAFNSDGTKLYAAVGQEHSWGRWWRMAETKNQIVIIDLLIASPTASSK